MSENLIEKITRYNLFNHLLPGVVFMLISSYIFGFNIEKLSGFGAMFALFFAYFLGTVISRIGSILIEPILKWIGFVKFAEYDDFLSAAKVDTKIDKLSEENNVYRTYIAVFIILLLLVIVKSLVIHYSLNNNQVMAAGLFLLFVLFLFSYRKQTWYIRKRIIKRKDKHE